ncbi:flagellar basal body P-ring protein FlgI [Paracoccus pacificus]|uniref:Flagellar P-ring protein n=1 Tax=Paracoccus pacificus TaxID=1463598 RepID=A0ABW4R3Q5_9RHOB
MRALFSLLGAVLVALALIPQVALSAPVRIKDLVNFDGVRGNDLVGYGLVVGLNGTGDTIRNAPFTEDLMAGVLERLGVNVSDAAFRTKNAAAVMVTASLPAFARAGSQIDVNVAAIGDAKSLLGGTLIMTPLNAADGDIYAVAQGSIIASGAVAGGDAAVVVQGVPTSGAIPSGGRVEREVGFDFQGLTSLRLALRSPDFTTAERIERAINTGIGKRIAMMTDAGTISLDLSVLGNVSPAHLIGRIENIPVEPQTKARVVIDHRTGTIVMGEDVRVSRVAVSQGGLTLRVKEEPGVSQPNPFAPGETVIVPRTQASIEEQAGIGLYPVDGGSSLSDVVAGLNALGVSPRDLIDILRSIHAAGALHAELVIN